MFGIIIVLIMIGLGAGTLGSMIGVGGGLFMTPALTFMGFTPAQIASTSLIAVTSTSVSSTIEYSRQKRIDYRIGLKIAALAIPGAIIGAFLTSKISIEYFKIYFAIVLMLIGLYIAYKNSIIKEKPNKKLKLTIPFHILLYIGSFVAGIISSLFGIGGGIIFVPMMIILLRMAMLRAGPTSQLTLLITSLTGMSTHVILGHPDYIDGISLAVGAFIGGQIGARLSPCVKESILQKLLSITLIGVGIKLLFDFINRK